MLKQWIICIEQSLLAGYIREATELPKFRMRTIKFKIGIEMANFADFNCVPLFLSPLITKSLMQ